MKYPESYFPERFFKIGKSIPSLPIEPDKPTAPKEPIKPSKKSNNDKFDKKNFGCFALFAVGLIVVIFTVDMGDNFPVGALLGAVFLLFITGSLFIGLSSSDRKYKKEYPQRLEVYNRELAEYPTKVKNYELALEKYELKYDVFTREKDKILSKDNLQNHRLRLLKEYLDSIEPLDKQVDENARIGASEGFFLEILKDTNRFIVETSCRMKVFDSFYYPDIVLIDEKTGLMIDLEIDEPYVGSDGKPIHYLTKEYFMQESIDKKRNDFFIQNGWVVVRFAEEQIIKETKECVDFLYNLIDSVYRFSFDNIEFKGEKIAKWSKDEAYNLGYKRYRHSYLPIEFHDLIIAETY